MVKYEYWKMSLNILCFSAEPSLPDLLSLVLGQCCGLLWPGWSAEAGGGRAELQLRCGGAACLTRSD